MRFESPWALLFLLPLAVALYLARRRDSRPALRFSSTAQAAALRPTPRQRLLGLPLVLRVLALLLLVVVVARPQEGRERLVDSSQGVAMEIVVDRSGSMRAEMEYGREKLNRLEVVKRVSREFVTGEGADLPGRPDDLLGLIVFARYADTLCPLTLGHDALTRFIDQVQLVTRQPEDGTAIGDAIALAAARLKTAEETLARRTGKEAADFEIKSKVIILFSDGRNNAGSRTPDEAAALAREWGIKIHTIGVGGDEGILRQFGPLGSFMIRAGEGVDKQTLARVAETTGGLFRMAEDGESLRAIYREIDRLERSEIETIRYLDYRELYKPFLLAALALLALETLLSTTLFRRIP